MLPLPSRNTGSARQVPAVGGAGRRPVWLGPGPPPRPPSSRKTHVLPHRTDYLLLASQADERLRSAISRQYGVLPWQEHPEMTLLVAGLVLFIAVHLVPSVVPLRAALIARLGPGPYRGLFSLVAAAGLVLIVWGFARAPFEPLYAAPAWGRQVAMFAVPVALVLFAAANMPTHIRAVLRHPMLLGLLLCGNRPPALPTATSARSCCSAVSRVLRCSTSSAPWHEISDYRPTRRRASRWTRSPSSRVSPPPDCSRSSMPPSLACRSPRGGPIR